jgi:hypothetical protein
MEKDLAAWWIRDRKRLDKTRRKGFDSLVVLVWWQTWKERNARVFDSGHTAMQPVQLVQSIRDEGLQWVAAGYLAPHDLLQS